jgi:hypothetical protein
MRDVFEVKMIISRSESEKCVGVSRCYYSPHLLAEGRGDYGWGRNFSKLPETHP